MAVTHDIMVKHLNFHMELQATWHKRLEWWRNHGGSPAELIVGVCMDECRKAFINAKYWRDSLDAHVRMTSDE